MVQQVTLLKLDQTFLETSHNESDEEILNLQNRTASIQVALTIS